MWAFCYAMPEWSTTYFCQWQGRLINTSDLFCDIADIGSEWTAHVLHENVSRARNVEEGIQQGDGAYSQGQPT